MSLISIKKSGRAVVSATTRPSVFQVQPKRQTVFRVVGTGVGPQGPQGNTGPQGPTGPAGADGESDKTYEHPFTNLSTIVVTHNLDKYPAVTIVDSAGDEVIGDVSYDNINQVTINLSASTGGVVYLN